MKMKQNVKSDFETAEKKINICELIANTHHLKLEQKKKRKVSASDQRYCLYSDPFGFLANIK